MMFTIYSKPDCPYCKKIKDILEIISVNFVEYTLDEHFNKENFYSEFGKESSFPQIVVNENHIGGCMDTIKYLRENNLI